MSSCARRVWRIASRSLDSLRCEPDVLQPPPAGHARIAVRAIGLNFADIFACLGLYAATPKGEFTPGLEFAGVVDEIGPASAEGSAGLAGADDAPLRPGDRVMGLTRFGGYATHINADVRYLRRIPEAWSFAEGAAFLAQALTAWYALVELGGLKVTPKGAQRPAWRPPQARRPPRRPARRPPRGGLTGARADGAGAVGGRGVGLLALEILKKTGAARAVAAIGSASKAPLLKQRFGLPDAQIIVRDRKRFAEQIDEALFSMGLPSSGLDLVLDSVGGDFFAPAFDRLARGGRAVVFGAADFMTSGSRPNWLWIAWQYLRRPKIDPFQMISDNKAVMAFNLIFLWDKVDEIGAMLGDILALGGWSETPPLVGATFAFERTVDAMRALQSGSTVGKVVVEVPEGRL
eukprot:tig00000241_g21000.t1